MAQDEEKTRAYELGFKKSTGGLTESEQKELDELAKRQAMANRMQTLKPQG